MKDISLERKLWMSRSGKEKERLTAASFLIRDQIRGGNVNLNAQAPGGKLTSSRNLNTLEEEWENVGTRNQILKRSSFHLRSASLAQESGGRFVNFICALAR